MKIGVIGVGHLGKIHLRCISEIPEYEIVGFADTDPGRASEVSAQFGIRAFDQIDELMDQVDAVSIVTPTTSHFELARLGELGIARVELMTNNPQKIVALREHGIDVVSRISLVASANAHNERYLRAKLERAGHLSEDAVDNAR